LFALNPFGQKAFDPRLEESRLALARGGRVSFLWRVVIHSGDADIAGLYRAFEHAGQKPGGRAEAVPHY
jgi:hypothetical protein